MTAIHATEGPLLVFGPRSETYDFGPGHPLTPRRFGPGIDLLRVVGAVPGLAPEPVDDLVLGVVHDPAYLAAVRRFSTDPGLAPAFGIAPFGDVPAFAGMHEAAAAVAGGTLGGLTAILEGRAEHAYHPGGGLHHAMRARASGFCVYNDVALAIAVARRAGLRVLYVDLDVHHGDGVEAIHADDPGVMTISIHESGRHLFPGTGAAREIGDGISAATVVNLPLEPLTGETGWLAAVRGIVPSVAAAFGPDLVVSQHGADSHAWDPLAHLRVTTTAMGEAARLVDVLAHRWAAGRWLATGGGGYEVDRVVPRAWALTWLAGAHRDVPDRIPAAWRARWAPDARRAGSAEMPARFVDEPNAGLSRGAGQDAAEDAVAAVVTDVRGWVLPRILDVAEDRGWWDPVGPARSEPVVDPGQGQMLHASGSAARSDGDGRSTPTLVVALDRPTLKRLRLAPRTIAPADVREAMTILHAALADGAWIAGAVVGDLIVGLAVLVRAPDRPGAAAADELIALGVAPAWRGAGLGRALARSAVEAARDRGVALVAEIGAGDRDALEPVSLEGRRNAAERILLGAGLVRADAAGPSGSVARRRYVSRSRT